MNRRHRLRGRRRFAAVRASRVETRSGSIRVRASVNGLGVSRAGFSIVAAPHAVARNRVRRRLRAIVRPVLLETGGIDLVVTAPATVDALTAAGLRETVTSLVAGAMAEVARR